MIDFGPMILNGIEMPFNFDDDTEATQAKKLHQMVSDVIAELDRTMKINEDIIRFLIVRVEKFDDRDNLITQMKTFVDEFGGMAKDKGYRSFKNSAEDNIEQAEKVSVTAAE